MGTRRIGKTYILDKEIEAALRGSSPVRKQNIPVRSKIKILPSSPTSFYEFKVVDCVLKSIGRKQVYVIARSDLDGVLQPAD